MLKAFGVFFSRSWVLYALMVLVFALIFKRVQSCDDILNASRPGGEYAHAVAYGLKEYDQDEFLKAVAYYRTLLLSNPWTPMVQANLGFCYFYLHQNDKSIDAYRKAIEKAPRIYAFYFDMGFISMINKNYDVAAKFFEQSLELYPSTRSDLLRALNISPKYENQASIAQDSFFIKRYELDRKMLYVNLGHAYEQLKDYKRLLIVAVQGINLYPYDPQLYYYAGLASLNLGRLKEASDFLLQATSLAPNFAECYYYQAMVMKAAGDLGLYEENMIRAQRAKEQGSWKRNKDIFDLHHWHDDIIFFQIYR